MTGGADRVERFAEKKRHLGYWDVLCRRRAESRNGAGGDFTQALV
jgi:hypothetical protein